MNGRVVISGCSGGGKTSLLEELARRGYRTVPEPGRRIVREELAASGAALPWVDMTAFAWRALELAAKDIADAPQDADWIFFDRGLIDAAVAFSVSTETPLAEHLNRSQPYHDIVFLVPPWREIYVQDDERALSYEVAVSEYIHLRAAYPSLGYQVAELPRVSVAERADLILSMLGVI